MDSIIQITGSSAKRSRRGEKAFMQKHCDFGKVSDLLSHPKLKKHIYRKKHDYSSNYNTLAHEFQHNYDVIKYSRKPHQH